VRKTILRVRAEAARVYDMQAQEEERSWNDRERFGRIPPGLDAQTLEEECPRDEGYRGEHLFDAVKCTDSYTEI